MDVKQLELFTTWSEEDEKWFFYKKRYWGTPKWLYDKLNEEFKFDFDPCPNPRPEGFDGLKIPWGKSNYVNPPFTGGVKNWILKCLYEKTKGNKSILILPTFQERSLKNLHLMGYEIRWIGPVNWIELQTGETKKETGSNNVIIIIK